MARGSRPLTLRLPDELWGRLEREVERRGVARAVVVRDALEAWLVRDLPLVSSTEAPAAAGGDGLAGEVDLATWLAGRTGQPRALLRARMSAGRVTVDGRPVFEGRVLKGSLRLVRLDGEAV